MFAHVDMNSYFASVEQQANPQLRGRPLGVCAYLHKAGCVIAASIEAKKCGVKVGMSISEAKQICPQMKFIQNDPAKYRAVSSRVFSLFHELTDKVEHYSIDEVFLDLTGWYRDEAEASWALCKARLRIQSEVGEWLTCSIGIAPNKILAKLASEMQKPNGLTIINLENLDAMLATRDLEDACGIGKRIRRRLHRLGIYNLIDLKNYPVGNLIRALGVAGYYWHERLSANEVDRFEQSSLVSDVGRGTIGTSDDDSASVIRNTKYLPAMLRNALQAGEIRNSIPKSIGHSFCVPKRANEQNLILPILLRLTERAGRRLRSFGHYARAMTVQINYTNDPLAVPHESERCSGVKGGYPAQSAGLGDLSDVGLRAWDLGRVTTIKFTDPANDPFSLVHAATQALEQIWHGEQITFLAITLSDLAPPNHQLQLDYSLKSPLVKGGYPAQSAGLGDFRPLVKGGYSRHRLELGDSIDAIRDRHGEESIIFASMMGLSSDYAPDRIGFRKTEGVDVQMSGY
jgi:nucleotidyltransferase/DNA polymerase involved in DNA repair